MQEGKRTDRKINFIQKRDLNCCFHFISAQIHAFLHKIVSEIDYCCGHTVCRLFKLVWAQ